MTKPTTLAHLKKMSSRSSKNRLAPAPRFDRAAAGQARKAFAGLLEKGIPDLARLSGQFDEIARKSQADAAREAKKNRALALKQSRNQKKVIAEAIAARMDAFDLLAAEPGVDSPQYYFLNSPFEDRGELQPGVIGDRAGEQLGKIRIRRVRRVRLQAGLLQLLLGQSFRQVRRVQRQRLRGR